MKILSNLKATATEGAWTEPRGILQTIHDEPAKGFFRKATLGAGGLILERDKNTAVGIPLAELFALAAKFEPGLLPPKPQPAQ